MVVRAVVVEGPVYGRSAPTTMMMTMLMTMLLLGPVLIVVHPVSTALPLAFAAMLDCLAVVTLCIVVVVVVVVGQNSGPVPAAVVVVVVVSEVKG